MQYIVYTVTENPFWDAWAESIELKTHTGFFSFKIEDYPGGIYCGIAKNGIASSVSEIKYGFYIESNKFAAVESGSLKTNLTPFSIGSVFKISVKDSSIVLSVDDVDAFSFEVNWFATNQSYRLYFGGYSFGDAVVDAAHGFEQTEANVFSSSQLPVSVISCDSQNPISICSETTSPICTAIVRDTAFIDAETYQPNCNIVTGNEPVASISSSVPFPTARLTSIRIPFVSYVNTLTYPVFSRTYATTPARISTTAIPAESIVFEGRSNCPAIIVAELPQIFSFARTQNDSFFYSTITLPLLRAEAIGLGLISGKVFEIDSDKSKIIASTIRGAKIGTETKGMVDRFAISIREDSAIYAGSAIIEEAAISLSGEILSLASAACIKAHGILEVSGSVLAGASMKLSKPLHLHGELNSSSDVHASIEMREEEEALSISGNMYGPKYELAYICADRLFSIDGTFSSEIVSASIIAALTIISEESVLVNASRISATIDIALAMESAIDGYLSSLGVSSTVTTASRAQKIIAISGKVLASTSRSQR